MLDDDMKYILKNKANGEKKIYIASCRQIATLNMIREWLTEKMKLKKNRLW